MTAIFKREFRSYFQTVIGELFIGMNIIIFGYFFVRYNMLNLSNNLNGALYNTAFIGLVFMIPILCMRSFSEERKQKTDQLIMTAPVTVGGIVFGKFLAIAAVFTIPTAVTCILPPIMGRFGDVPYLWNYACILDYWLYGLMMIAICIFISSLTENQIISVVISVAVLLGGTLLGDLFENIKTDWLKDLLNSTINFNGRLMTILLGSFDLTSIVFFISVTVLFLFLTTQVLQKRRYTISKSNLSVSAYSSVTIIAVTAVVVVLNLVSLQIPDKFREVDLTSSKVYSITDDSKKIAAGITDDITLYFMAKENDETFQTKDQTVEKILRNYVDAGKTLKLSYIDPVVNAKFYQRYTDSDPGYSAVIVDDATTGRSKVVSYSDMYVSEINYTTYTEDLTGYDIEGQITTALQYVTLTEDSLVKAYYTSGHNEATLDTYFTKILDNDNIVLDELSLLKDDSIPDDAELLIINAPTADFTPSEAELVIGYLEKGNNAIIVTSPDTPPSEMKNFSTILDWYGLSLSEGLVLDNAQGYYYATFGSPAYLLTDLSSSDPITSGLAYTGLQTVFLPEAQAIQIEDRDEVEVTRLLTTSDQAVLSTDQTQSDAQSFTVGAKAVRTLDSGTSTVVIYSSPMIFNNKVDDLIAGMNQKLFDNTVDALTELATDFVTIPAKSVESYLTIPMTLLNVLEVIGFALIAAIAIIIAGIVIWAVRRKK